MIAENVVCGVDPTPESQVAARLAARIASPEGSLLLLSVEDPSAAVQAGWSAPTLLQALEQEAQRALAAGETATATMHAAETRMLVGNPITCLLDEAASRDATLIVVGSHGHSRALGIALGSVATAMLHDAPCSVLVAREPLDLERWPTSIVVGVDGSTASERALAVGLELAERFGSDLRAVCATDDRHVDLEAATHLAPDVEEHEARAVDTLVVASEHADLVVVGSRGLRGLRALGSVSERVAHEARGSVLVVRSPGLPTAA